MLVRQIVATVSLSDDEMRILSWLLRKEILEKAEREQPKSAEEFLNDKSNKELIEMYSTFSELCGWRKEDALYIIKEGIEKAISNRKEWLKGIFAHIIVNVDGLKVIFVDFFNK